MWTVRPSKRPPGPISSSINACIKFLFSSNCAASDSVDLLTAPHPAVYRGAGRNNGTRASGVPFHIVSATAPCRGRHYETIITILYYNTGFFNPRRSHFGGEKARSGRDGKMPGMSNEHRCGGDGGRFRSYSGEKQKFKKKLSKTAVLY